MEISHALPKIAAAPRGDRANRPFHQVDARPVWQQKPRWMVSPQARRNFNAKARGRKEILLAGLQPIAALGTSLLWIRAPAIKLAIMFVSNITADPVAQMSRAKLESGALGPATVRARFYRNESRMW
jgi:hypothetical protein